MAKIDTRPRAWDLRLAMRIWIALAAAVFITVFFAAGLARASAARNAVASADAALASAPPAIAAARDAAARALTADDDDDAVAEALLLLGQLDEADSAFAQAIARDRACIAKAPASRWAVRAADRIEWLSARSEGDFAPLVKLEHVRRDAALASDPSAVATLAQEADTFPPGLVRVEARMLVAHAWLGRLERPEDAAREFRLVARDQSADPLTARLAERELVGSLITRGAVGDAAAEAEGYAHQLDPRFLAHVRRLARRRWLRDGAIVELFAFAALAMVAVARAARRRALRPVTGALRSLAPAVAGFAVYVAVIGGTLASRYDAGNAAPFLWLGVVIVPLLLGARMWSAAGASHRAARLGRALLAGASVIAAAFVLLDAVNPTYLDGFGL